MPPSPAPSESEVERIVFECLEAEDVDLALEQLERDRPELGSAVRMALQGLRDRGLVPRADLTEEIPERLGVFRLVRQLGIGGMGVVYLAEQEDLAREVALKLIRPEHLFFPGSRERFRREVEAVARLQHVGIAQIHTVGEERGVPFYAMEYVDGPSLSQLLQQIGGKAPADVRGADVACAVRGNEPAGEDRSPSPSSSSSSSTTRRAFEQPWTQTCVDTAIEIGEALQHAHERGVLHRDVKPSNVLMTRDGRARLVDFGLARLEGAQQLTATASQIGSLPYLPPEHLEGAGAIPAPNQDVYALGVTLYEMLALRSAFQRDSAEQTRAAIRDGRPAPLRSRNPSVNSDLATVIATAMAHSPGQRYPSMADFVRDLDNVRNHRPITARKPSFWMRASRWAQRHPTSTASVAVGIVLVAIAAILFAVFEGTARRRSDELRTAAEQRAREASEVTDFLVDLFRFASPDRALGEELPVGMLLQQAAGRVQRELEDQPDVRARLLGTLARVYSWLGENERSADMFAEAVAVLTARRGPQDADVLNYRTLEAIDRTVLGQYDRSEQLLQAVEANVAATDPVRRHGLDLQARRTRSVLLHTQGDTEGAERMHREVLAAARQRPDELTTLCTATRTLARFLDGEQRHTEALAQFREALELHQRAYPEGHPSTVTTLHSMANTLADLHQYDEAIELVEQALVQCRNVFGDRHPRMALVHRSAASVFRASGDLQRALREMEQCEELVRGMRGASRNFFARSLNDLGITYHDIGRYQDACRLLEEALVAAREAFAGDHILTASLLLNLANAESEYGKSRNATEHAEKALAMMRRLDPRARSLPHSLNTLALIQSRMGSGEAMQAANNTVEDARKLAEELGELTWEEGRAYAMKSYLANMQNRGADGERFALRALELLDEANPNDHQRKALTLYNVAWALLTQGKGLEAAEPFLKRSLEMYERMPQTYPDKAYPLNHYGYELLDKRAAEAKPLLEEALEIRRRTLPPGAYWRLVTTINLANAHQRLREFDAAETLLLEVYEWLADKNGKQSPEARSSAQRLVWLYQRWGKPEQAARYEALK